MNNDFDLNNDVGNEQDSNSDNSGFHFGQNAVPTDEPAHSDADKGGAYRSEAGNTPEAGPRAPRPDADSMENGYYRSGPRQTSRQGSSQYTGGYRPFNPYGQNGGQQWQQGGYQQNQQQYQPPYQYQTGQYDAVGEKKGKRKNKGLAVFGIIVACVLAISVFSFAGYGIYTMLTDGVGLPLNNGQSQSGAPSDPTLPSIDINDQPQGGSATMNVVEGDRMTAAQVHKKVSPAIVGITVYYQSTGFSSPAIGSGIIMSSEDRKSVV